MIHRIAIWLGIIHEDSIPEAKDKQDIVNTIDEAKEELKQSRARRRALGYEYDVAARRTHER